MTIDFDDCIKLEDMCTQSDFIVRNLNTATEDMADAEVELSLAIASCNIKDSLTWKKQIIELIKQDEKYVEVYKKYSNAKTQVSINRGLLRALETRINCLKKKISVTPAI